jgi:apolipoprotein N-acyltransferase
MFRCPAKSDLLACAVLTLAVIAAISVFKGWCPACVYCCEALWIAVGRSDKGNNRVRLAAAIFGSLAVGWLTTGCLSVLPGTPGVILRYAAPLLIATRYLTLHFASRRFRQWPPASFVLMLTFVMTCLESVHDSIGVSRCVHALCLATVDLGVGQLTHFIGLFGVEALIHACNAIIALSLGTKVPRFVGTCCLIASCDLVLLFSFGGLTVVSPADLPRMVLIQPGFHRELLHEFQMSDELREQTCSAIAQSPDVELIVWPESAAGVIEEADLSNQASRIRSTLFGSGLSPSLLAGVTLRRANETFRYGIPMQALKLQPAAILISSHDGIPIQIHRKQRLVPFREEIPQWISDSSIRSTFEWSCNSFGNITCGDGPGHVSLPRRDTQPAFVGVAICYESYFPELNSFDRNPPRTIIFHLVYDGETWEYPEIMNQHIRSVRLRAIETRTWQVVCSTWQGSCLIDPTGRVRRQLGSGSGTLFLNEVDFAGS